MEVLPEQASFVAPNVWTLAETRFHPWVECEAIVVDRVMVGFLAYGREPEEERYWLYRFMIDRHHQGRGYGRAGLRALIERLRLLPDCDEITVGFAAENAVAERLYLSEGFVRGPRAPWGEETATLRLVMGDG